MVRREKTKATALVVSAICIIISAVQYVVLSRQQSAQLLQHVGIMSGCTLLARLAYSFFHAGIVHCLVNCWCMLSVVFIYPLSLSRLLIAYAVAVTYPFATDTPTVGLSAVCFCLLGQVSWLTRSKLFFHLWIAGFIAFTYLLPFIFLHYGITIAFPDNTLHIYSYVVGLMVGFLYSPAPWQQRQR